MGPWSSSWGGRVLWCVWLGWWALGNGSTTCSCRAVSLSLNCTGLLKPNLFLYTWYALRVYTCLLIFFFFQILISSEWRRKKVAGQWQKGECECVMIGCSYFCFIMLFLIINNLFLIMNTYISFASSLLFFGYKSLGFPLIMVDQLFLFSNWANAAGVVVHFYLWSTTSLHFPHFFLSVGI